MSDVIPVKHRTHAISSNTDRGSLYLQLKSHPSWLNEILMALTHTLIHNEKKILYLVAFFGAGSEQM